MNTPETMEKRLNNIIEETSKAVTDYGYNDEYGYYNDWKDGVKPIIEKSITLAVKEREREIVEKIDGSKEVYTEDSEFGNKGDEKAECDSEWNEALNEALFIIQSHE